MCCTIKASNALYGGGVMAVFCTFKASNALYGGGVMAVFCTIKASNALYGGGVMTVFCTNEAHSERRRLAVHSYYTYVKESRSVQRRLAAVLRSWSRSEPRFFDWSRSRFKILLKPEPTFLGRLRLLFLAVEKL